MPPIAPITPPHNVQKKRKRHTATLAKVSIYFLKAGFAWNSGIFSENYYYIPKDGLFLSISNKGHAIQFSEEFRLSRIGFVKNDLFGILLQPDIIILETEAYDSELLQRAQPRQRYLLPDDEPTEPTVPKGRDR